MHRMLIMSVSVTAEFFVTPEVELYVKSFKLNEINLYPSEQDFSLIETFEVSLSGSKLFANIYVVKTKNCSSRQHQMTISSLQFLNIFSANLD